MQRAGQQQPPVQHGQWTRVGSTTSAGSGLMLSPGGSNVNALPSAMSSSQWLTSVLSFTSPHSVFSEDPVHPLTVRSSMAIMSFFEKFLLMIDFFQLFALLWVAAQPWPWPYIFVHFSQPLVAFNADYFSTTNHGALAGRTSSISMSKWGQLEHHYLFYAMVFAIFGLLLGSLTMIFHWAEYLPFDVYGKWTWMQRHRSWALFASLLLSYVFYLPCSLAVFRLYYCEKGLLAADPSVTCLSLSHSLCLLCGTVSIAPLLLLTPYLFYHFTKGSVLYSDTRDHEKKLQMWELTSMWDLDDYWIDEQVWIIGSFTRCAAYLRFHTLLLKLVWLLVFIFVRDDFQQQSSIMTVSLCVFLAYYWFFQSKCLIRLPYRTWSSTLMFLVVSSLLLIDVVFGTADAYNVRNVVTVGSTQSLVLLIVNGVGIGFMLFIVLGIALSPQSALMDWPSMRTLTRIMTDTDRFVHSCEWVELLREARTIRTDFLLTPVEVADIRALEKSIRDLRNAWMLARSLGSVFEPILSEQLENQLLVHAHSLPEALRKIDHWDSAYRDAISAPVKSSALSISRNRTTATHNDYDNEENDDTKRDTAALNVFGMRNKQYVLMNPRKRRILTKLLALRAMQERYFKGFKGEFSMDIAKKQREADELFEAKRLRKRLRKQRDALRKQWDAHWLGFHRSQPGRFSWALFRMQLQKYLGLGKNSDWQSLLAEAATDEKDDETSAEERDSDEPVSSSHRVAGEQAKRKEKPHLHIDVEDAETGNAEPTKGQDDERQPLLSGQSSLEGAFTAEMIEEARKMITRLQQRTELALNKHSKATKQIFEQQKQQFVQAKLDQLNAQQGNSFPSTPTAIKTGGVSTDPSASPLSPTSAIVQSIITNSNSVGKKTLNASANTLNKLGLSKIATMDLIKETVDEEEQRDLEDLFHLWDEAIHLYEEEQFPGDYEKLNNEVENWYAYRGLVSQRLDLVMRLLRDQLTFLDDLDAQHVVEEDDEDLELDDDDNDNDILDNDLLTLNSKPKNSASQANIIYDEECPPPDRFSEWN